MLLLPYRGLEGFIVFSIMYKRKYKEPALVLLILLSLYLISARNYLLFHTVAEMFSVVVASAVFVIVWNSRSFMKNNYLLFIGIAYLFIGGLDLLHTLGYKGMGVFPEHDANLPTQLWILGRYMESISFLIAPFFLERALNPKAVLSGYFLITALALVSVFTGFFPDSFIEGHGLTTFKVLSEYLISLILLGSLIVLRKHRDRFDSNVLFLLSVSIILTIVAELFFTFYIDVYDFSNLMGHYLKLLSFYLVYKAVVVTGLTKPYDLLYRELKQSEIDLRKEKEAQANLAETLSLVNRILRHDILNDLNVIYMAVDNLSERDESRETELSKQAVNRSLKLIEEMRNLEDTGYSGCISSSELRQMIGEISQDFPVQVNIIGECNVIADKALNSVIGNILRNAIVHGKADTIDIRLEQGPELCEIQIADNGCGIPDDIKAHVFEKGFKHGETGHTGFGLYIAHKVISRYGEITLKDNYPTGTVFILKLRSAESS